MVSQHRYIYTSDLWDRTAGKRCSVHIMYSGFTSGVTVYVVLGVSDVMGQSKKLI